MNKSFLIIQLTRIGDLVQTYQAAKELKAVHPEVRLKLVARESFAKPLSFLLNQVFDEIIYLNIQELFANKLSDYLANVNKWLEQETLQNNDVLINLSFCEQSNYLATVLNSKHKLGTRVDDKNQVIVKDQWSQLVYSFVMSGPYCPFNLVDIYKNIFGLKPSVKELTTKVSDKKHLAIHPFASDAKKRWKPSKWTEVIFKFLKDNTEAHVHLFGAKNEIADVEIITKSSILKKFSDRIHSHVGQFNLEETFNKLGECSHFLGHDSLLGHLAKVQSLPTLTISLGTVRPIETTPYGANSYVMSPRSKCFPCFPNTDCNFYQCHADLSYQATSEVLNQFVATNEINAETLYKNVSPFHLDSVDIYEFGQSKSGLFTLDKIGKDAPLFREFIKDIYRIGIAFKFEEIEESLSFPNLQREDLAKITHLKQGIQQYYELCDFGKKYSHYILTEISQAEPDIAKIKEFAAKIDDIDRLQDLLKKTYPQLTSVIDFYKVMKFNLSGENLVEISESSYLVYNDNMIFCSVIYELFEQTINHLQKKFGIKAMTKDGNA